MGMKLTPEQFDREAGYRFSLAVMGALHSADEIDHIEMHPQNHVLFVFADGHPEEYFWKDHSRKDSWDAEKRKKAAEKTKAQHLAKKERAAQ